jgi:hypothetical protein
VKAGWKQGIAPAAAILVLIGVIIAVALTAARPGAQGSAAQERGTSTFSSTPGGAKAAYLVMRKFLPTAERWAKPLRLLKPPTKSRPTTLLVMDPVKLLNEADADALDTWVKNGGQLIIAAGGPWWISKEITEEDASTHLEDYLVRHGFTFTKEASSSTDWIVKPIISNPPLLLEGGFLKGLVFSVEASSEKGVTAASVAFGSGRIYVIADGNVFSNERLSRSQNAAWIVLTALGWKNGHVLVDEYHQGYQEGGGSVFSILFSFLGTLWGAAFLQLAAAGILYLWWKARRFGPIIEAPKPDRRDPIARVQGIAAMLEAGRAKPFAVRAIRTLEARRLAELRRGPGAGFRRGGGFGRAGAAAGTPEAAAHEDADFKELRDRGMRGSSISDAEFLRFAHSSGEHVKEHIHARQRRS